MPLQYAAMESRKSIWNILAVTPTKLLVVSLVISMGVPALFAWEGIMNWAAAGCLSFILAILIVLTYVTWLMQPK